MRVGDDAARIVMEGTLIVKVVVLGPEMSREPWKAAIFNAWDIASREQLQRATYAAARLSRTVPTRGARLSSQIPSVSMTHSLRRHWST